MGVVHPVFQRRDDYHSNESVIVSRADVVIHPVHPDADHALQQYIRVHHMEQLPHSPRASVQPTDQSPQA